MSILITAIHILLIFLIAWRIRKGETFLKKIFWPALFIKLIAGIALGLLYTYYYPVADTFVYYKDASKLASLALRNFSAYANLLFFNTGVDYLHLTFYEPRALFLTKITSVFNILTLHNYWIISLYFSLVSFSGAWFLVKTINRHLSSVTTPAVIAFLFFPSIVFWTSGLIKESLAVPALYYLTAFFLKIWFNEKQSILSLVLAAISLWIFWSLKYYYVAIFIPVVCASLFYKFIIRKRFDLSAGVEAVVWITVLILPFFLISFLHPNFYPERFSNVIVLNNEGYNKLSDPEDVVHFNDLQPAPGSIIQNAPWALFSGLFRPFFWEAGNILQFLSGVENSILLGFFLAALSQIKRYVVSPHRILVHTLVVYVTLLAIFITLSAPNFGTLSRYRSGYLPFFVFLILCHNPLLNYFQRSFHRLVSH